jgi:hypothetical protein
MKGGTLVKIYLGAVALLLLILSSLYLYDSVSIWEARNYPIRDAKITEREPLKGFSLRRLIAPSEVLTIQVKESPTKVTTVLFKRDAAALPDDVKVHFDANRKNNIVVVGQKTRWYLAIVGFGIVGIILLIYWGRRFLLAFLIMRSFAKKGSYP